MAGNNLGPFAKMKRDLVQAVASEANPSEARLRETFLEEFGAPPTPEIIELFHREVGRAAGPATEPAREEAPAAAAVMHKAVGHINLIRERKPAGAVAAPEPEEEEPVESASCQPGDGLLNAVNGILENYKMDLARTVASIRNPTRAKLHEAFLAEFGQGPDRAHVTLFLCEAQANRERSPAPARSHKAKASHKSGKKKQAAKKAVEQQRQDVEDAVADCFDLLDEPAPPAPAKEPPAHGIDRMKADLVRAVLADPNPTEALLKEMYLEEFGSLPPKEIRTYFARELDRKQESAR